MCVCNEYAGSDGDIFSHGFKLMKLGKLIGMRTWGGVIGIWPRQALVDGTMTTQPEFSVLVRRCRLGDRKLWHRPDIEVNVSPQDYSTGTDPQLEVAIQDILAEMEANPRHVPDFSEKPSRALPKLPPA